MFRKLLKIIGFLALVAFVIVTLAFTASEVNNATCRSIEVEYDSDEIIKINKEEIIRLVTNTDKQILTKKLEQINAETIEDEVEKHQAVLNAEVYKVIVKDSSAYKGILTVRVKHREPVVRIISNSANYYLDEFGRKIPVSSEYTANVLVATGYINEKFARETLLPGVLYIENNEFWEAQIEQVHISQDGNVILTPLVGDHIIELGTLDNYQGKLRNMKAFYKKVLANNNWNKYKSISLKYNNQVIAKRR
ncbi:MAG: hypothetical protein ABFS16_06735 [Bacteroidota bacterium]